MSFFGFAALVELHFLGKNARVLFRRIVRTFLSVRFRVMSKPLRPSRGVHESCDMCLRNVGLRAYTLVAFVSVSCVRKVRRNRLHKTQILLQKMRNIGPDSNSITVHQMKQPESRVSRQHRDVPSMFHLPTEMATA